tara:strand:+ start:119 stop:1174 length:1056 start_codon:yes stop_codon:yes gene_type:complete
MEEKKKIILIAGGTGGHVFPALALSEFLKEKKANYCFLTDQRCKIILDKYKVDYKLISSSQIKKNIFSLPIMFLRILFGVTQSLIFFLNSKPKSVIGFGGYTCLPPLLAAIILKIPIYIHEQNAIMGQANRLFSRYSKKVLLGFKFTTHSTKNSDFVGVPIRKKFLELRKKRSANKFIKILVLGGSQGAGVFLKILPKVLSSLRKKDLKKLVLIQQAKKDQIKILQNIYSNFGLKFTLKSFFDNIPEIMNESDIILTRCGASTLAELNFLKKPSILFPLPTAKDNHQLRNARAFAKLNKCTIINENQINHENVIPGINKLILDCKNSKNDFEKLNPQETNKKIFKILNAST